VNRFAPALSVLLAGIPLVVAVHGCGSQWDGTPAEMTWELKGKHLEVPCEGCHPPGNPPGRLPTACESCHEPDRPDPHFDGPCGDCHTEFGWGEIVHDFFPLEDAHALECEACHTGGDFSGLSPECSSCHEADRPADHFVGSDCDGCHVPTVWADAQFDHDFFPLRDAHDLECGACHAGEGYTGLNGTCTSCHEADRPAGHFGDTDCGNCHPTTRWEDGEFDHTPFFPLPHRGVSACASCHLTGDYGVFSCIDCHEHARSETDSHHQEVSGYRYDSEACLDCHPDGRVHDQ